MTWVSHVLSVSFKRESRHRQSAFDDDAPVEGTFSKYQKSQVDWKCCTGARMSYYTVAHHFLNLTIIKHTLATATTKRQRTTPPQS